jgi:hypothetical protein
MRDMHLINSSKVWKAIQALDCDGEKFCRGCHRARLAVRGDDIQDSSLCDFRMSRHDTEKKN